MILKSKCKRLKGFEVETCIELPLIGPEHLREADYDNAKYTRKDFDTLEEAQAHAREVAPKDCFGAVAINEFIMEPVHGHPFVVSREYIGETIYVERL